MKRFLAMLCVTLLVPGNAVLFADPSPTAEAPIQAATLTPDQLNSLVAPIALYPDELVSQVLVASTYPLEVVQAYQWVQQHPALKGQELTTAAQQQSWDPSIQALVVFPDVLKRMNQDITWTTNLGNAFLANQGNVMDAIQKMRTRAQDAGKLSSTEQQNVVNTTDQGHPVIEIQPASPEVVYVPDYDPAWIWGPAPVYYPYPYWYYPPAPPLGFWCWWGGAIVVSSFFIGWHGWGGWGWRPHWYGRTVIVNNTFIHENHFREFHGMSGHGTTVWTHDSYHRLGVSYPNRGVAERFHSPVRPSTHPIMVNQARSELSRSADRMGNRQINHGVYNHNRSAFGGMEAGAAARAHSTRGNTSLGHVRTNRSGQPSHQPGRPGPTSGGNHGGESRDGGEAHGGGHGFGGGGHR